MNLFRTLVKIPEAKNKITFNTGSVFIGSCFTENIGNNLAKQKFPTVINPFGVLYNPVSIANSIDILINNKEFSSGDLQFHNELWFSFSHHSSFSHHNKDICINNINDKIKQTHDQLKQAEFLFISYGTSRVYINKETQEIVSNCHKLPSTKFEQKLLKPEELYLDAKKMIESLLRFNPKLQIVFTISPIRHWKDGYFGNQINKSTLFIIINKLLDEFKNANYFPSYEIMMDELRDYRFYSEDMIHINDTAIKYIYQKFAQTYFDSNVNEILKQIKKISSAYNHRPFNPESDAYKKFANDNLQLIQNVQKKNPHLNFFDEIAFFENILS